MPNPLVAQSAVLAVRDHLFSIRAKLTSIEGPGSDPAVVLVGVQRAGTSSLASWIHTTGRYSTGLRKEAHFFDRHFDRGLDWYRSQFHEGPSLDATPAYISAPNAIERMAQVLPSTTKLVVVLRDPCDRARSHFRYQVGRRLEWRSFADAIRDESTDFEGLAQPLRATALRHFRYVETGLYGRQLERLREALPHNPILICDFHRLFSGDTTEKRLLADFLEIPERQRSIPMPRLNGARPYLADRDIGKWAAKMFQDDQAAVTRAVGRQLSWQS